MPDSPRIYTAALIVIGDEILSGRTQDKNIAQVASWLGLQGIRLKEVRVVPDVTAAIVESVNTLRAAHDYLFTTGGIGPTHDDITVDAIAEALGVGVTVHPAARAILESYYETRGGLSDVRLRMARVPEGAELIPNRYTGAPGIRFGNIFIMAGVPAITAGMLDALSGTLEGGAPLLSETIGCWVQESEVAALLGETESAHPGCQIGSYPFWHEGTAGANFVIRSTDAEVLAACTRALVVALEGLGKPVVAGGIRPLAGRVLPLLAAACLAGCATAPDLARFERTLAAQDSATAALGEWCRTQGIADPPAIAAERTTGEDLAPSAEVRGLLRASPGEPIGYRHVRLKCGGKVLSVAHNWYVPSRLSPDMNRLLDTSDAPFGRVAAPLHFTRRRLAGKRGPLPGCPRDTILAHRAMLLLPDGRPLSALVECYTRANLARR